MSQCHSLGVFSGFGSQPEKGARIAIGRICPEQQALRILTWHPRIDLTRVPTGLQRAQPTFRSAYICSRNKNKSKSHWFHICRVPSDFRFEIDDGERRFSLFLPMTCMVQSPVRNPPWLKPAAVWLKAFRFKQCYNSSLLLGSVVACF